MERQVVRSEVLDFGLSKGDIEIMSNELFDDIAVLRTLAQLRSQQLLQPEDEAALLKQLKSEWGRATARSCASEE